MQYCLFLYVGVDVDLSRYDMNLGLWYEYGLVV